MNNAPRMTGSVDRVISVSLSEADWKAFLSSTPQPVQWLQQRIYEAIDAARAQQTGVTSPSSVAASDAASTTFSTKR